MTLEAIRLFCNRSPFISATFIALIFLAISAFIAMPLTGIEFGCPLDIGDRVMSVETGKKGRVVSIFHYGGGTSDCRVAIRFDDNTFTDNYEYNFLFDKSIDGYEY